jgi:hypothetical protein
LPYIYSPNISLSNGENRTSLSCSYQKLFNLQPGAFYFETDSSSHTNGFSQILRKQFQTQKELYITPSVIIFAALPQLIFTSSFVCTVLNYAWQRYGLLIAYLFSFIPQLCGFFIFVLPSSSYTTEFKKTKIDQTLLYVKKTIRIIITHVHH